MITASALAAVISALLAPLLAYAPTHFFSVRAPEPEPAKATIIFAGDMMFDRYIRTMAEREGDDHILSCVGHILHDADLVVANLEGPITDKPSVSVGTLPPDLNNFTFTFPTSTAPLLKRYNIGLVNLGNNHIMNFGEKGALSTMTALAEAGVGFFGSPLQSAFVRREVGGILFEFVSYNEFGGGGAEVALHQTQTARQNGALPIVYAHWGEEYVPPPERVRALAHQFVDAGAEIVIGSHPHVVQESEMYRGKHIYYSLGNFVFDQYWNEEVSTGLLLRVSFTENGVASVEEIPTTLHRDGRTCPKEG